jgi:hypothetical protein
LLYFRLLRISPGREKEHYFSVARRYRSITDRRLRWITDMIYAPFIQSHVLTLAFMLFWLSPPLVRIINLSAAVGTITLWQIHLSLFVKPADIDAGMSKPLFFVHSERAGLRNSSVFRFLPEPTSHLLSYLSYFQTSYFIDLFKSIQVTRLYSHSVKEYQKLSSSPWKLEIV